MSENSNKKPIIIISIVVLVLACIAAWYFLMYQPAQEAKEQARLAELAKVEAEQKRKELAAQNKSKYDGLIQLADGAFEQENWESARSLYTDASAVFPKETYPQDQLVLVNAKLDELAALAARIAAGVVDTVSAPTGRFYVIVSSSVDDDLAMDYASKLAKEGNSVKLIEHLALNELPFYGVAVADYATREEAEASLPSYSSFGEGVWVLKY